MKIKTGIYISGSITHDPDFVKKFELAANLLLEQVPDADIFNPAAHQNIPAVGLTEEELWAKYLCRDLCVLIKMRDEHEIAILVSMPGHRTSKGASLERAFAESIGFHLMDIRDALPDWDQRLAAVLPTKPELRSYSPKRGGKK